MSDNSVLAIIFIIFTVITILFINAIMKENNKYINRFMMYVGLMEDPSNPSRPRPRAIAFYREDDIPEIAKNNKFVYILWSFFSGCELPYGFWDPENVNKKSTITKLREWLCTK